jgi:hypothetical protein
MAKPLLCLIGMHRWKREVNSESGKAYQHCARCGADNDPGSGIRAAGGGGG